jgi:hypothetical protein
LSITKRNVAGSTRIASPAKVVPGSVPGKPRPGVAPLIVAASRTPAFSRTQVCSTNWPEAVSGPKVCPPTKARPW